jgi:large subunit ribosomal protein L22
MKAILRTIRISPKKVNLVASLVRNKKALDAIDILKFTPKKSAIILKKLVQSAIANAEKNDKQNKEDLYIKEIIVNEGATYKRSVPISRGRVHPILKRTSHITVKLENKGVKKEIVKKETEVKEVKTEEKTKKPATKKTTLKDKTKKLVNNK